MTENNNGGCQKRPILYIPYSEFEYITEIFALIGVLILVFITAKYWHILPDTIPTHFNAFGEPDAWGSKKSIFLLPVVTSVIYILLTILSRFPHTFNYICRITEQNARFQYQNARAMLICMKAEMVYTFIFIQWQTITVALGKANGLGVVFIPILIFIIFGTAIYFIYRSVKFR